MGEVTVTKLGLYRGKGVTVKMGVPSKSYTEARTGMEDVKMTEIKIYYAQLLKGADYFNRELQAGARTPYLARKMREFEREVVAPFDKACLRLSTFERQKLESRI